MRSAYNWATKMFHKRKALMLLVVFMKIKLEVLTFKNKDIKTDINVVILQLLYYKIQLLLIVSSNIVIYYYYYCY